VSGVPGRLLVTGWGLQPARHVSVRTLSEIENSDVVFALGDGLALSWLCDIHADVRDLGAHYDPRIDRRESYRAMQREILDAMAPGRRVCAVFYGHPAVYAQVGRKTLTAARAAGFIGSIEPAISADACLYADLELDPGEHGVQSFEATQFLIQRRVIDPAALVLLWQISQTGNLDCTGNEVRRDRVALLAEKLLRWYPANTPAILYEAAVLPIQDVRAERIQLADLPDARVEMATTLVIPPARAPESDVEMLSRLKD